MTAKPIERRAGLPLRPMTGYEEELVELRARDANTARLCNELLARCLVPAGSEPGPEVVRRVEGLLVAERDAELIALRRISLGDQVRSIVDCPHCGAGNEVDFDLAGLPIEFQRPPERIEVHTETGALAVLRPFTAGDQAALIDAAPATAAERRSVLLAALLVRYDDDKAPFDLAAVRALPMSERAALDGGLGRAVTGLDLTMGVSCCECEGDFTAPFDVAGFFFAELLSRARRLIEDIHVLARAYHWSEPEVLRLRLSRRMAYLLLLEREHDRALLQGALGR